MLSCQLKFCQLKWKKNERFFTIIKLFFNFYNNPNNKNLQTYESDQENELESKIDKVTLHI